MTTLHDLDTYVRALRPSRRKTATKQTAKPNGNGKPAVSASSLGRARALALISGRRVFAMNRPLDYEIPGIVSPLRQPTGMACWATSYTMLVSWRDQTSASIETRLGAIGKKWVDIFKADSGTMAEQEAEFFAAAGLLVEPLANPTLEGWEGLLRTYGPLIVIVDVDPSDKRAIHTLMLTGIHGDGTADGTTVTVVDPARGDKRPLKFSAFLSQYEQGAGRRTASGRFSQIVHWPKDVKFAGARSLVGVAAFNSRPGWPPPSTTPGSGTAAQPWSTYFPFRKGSNYEVDGPWSYNGTGTVLERTADFLKFSMKMPAISFLKWEIPAADIIVEATYKQEGKGNTVRVTINGVADEDKDAEIISSGNKRTVKPKLVGLSPTPEWITVEAKNADRVDITIRLDGENRDFTFNRTSGSSGLALGLEPWSLSFPFGAGTLYTVNGPLSYDGRGRVHERTDTLLKFEINMPSASIVNKKIPKLDLILEATYAKEGTGNQVTLTANGTKYLDANATITTTERGARRTIVPSIKIPNAGLEMISFAPDGRDQIDLDIRIDGTDHDFDLDKVTGSLALTTTRTSGASSTPAAALKEISAFAGRTGATKWKVARADVAKRLTDLVNNPDLVDQGSLNLCGPAAFFHLHARRDPLAFVKYTADLFEKGSGDIGTLKVTPKAGLVSNDYAAIAKRMSPVTPVAEWVALSAIRSSENSVFKFEGDPDENVAGITTPGDVEKWMNASGVYKKVTNDASWSEKKPLSHATALRPASNLDILMLINANIIQPPSGGRTILDAFPNHFIQLLSTVTSTAKGVEFDYWTWGMPGKQHAVVDPKAFAENYYGTVIGEI
jgi:hypothetical protein